MSKRLLYREYDEEGNLIKLECSHCHVIQTLDNFYKRKNIKDEVVTKCKKCTCEKQRKYQAEHKEERKEYNERYQEDNKEKLKEYGQQYRENNKEKISKLNKEYYQNNKKEIMKQHTDYRKKNREKVNSWNSNYRENNREKIREKTLIYQQNNREKVRECNRKYYNTHKDKESERKHSFYENNKDKVLECCSIYRNNKVNKELKRIYENVTKQLYPHKGIQYGVIYGVHCISTDRWYIGQTTKSFNIRYNADFFTYKTIELSKDSIKGKLLHEDIEKYGQENFEIFEVIDVAFSEKELDEKEGYYIDYYKAYDEGYNSNRGNIFKHNKLKRKEVI